MFGFRNRIAKAYTKISPKTDASEGTLQLEALEVRQMLSTVSVFAQGSTGDEAFTVNYQGEQIALFSSSGATNGVLPTDRLAEFQFDIDGDVSADDIRIEFLNDVFTDTEDRNLRIDRIEIDGAIYRTENSAVFSTGTWTAEDGVVDGRGRGDTLHANGYFQYSRGGFGGNNVSTLISFDAQAFGDVVDFELQVEGETVKKYSLSPRAGFSQGTFNYRVDGDVRVEDIRIAFTNDRIFTDPISGSTIDRNLKISSVTIADKTFDPNQSNVFSTGTWRPEDGVTSGFGRGDFLHANGYFTFSDPRATTEIRIEAAAFGLDNAEFDVLIDDIVVESYTARLRGRVPQVFTHLADGDVTADRIKIAFTNDSLQIDPLTSERLDRNLTIDEIQIGPNAVYNPFFARDIFSTGTWLAEDGVTPGFGRGSTLHTNGYFQVFPELVEG